MNAEQIEDRANAALHVLTSTDKVCADAKYEAEKALQRYKDTIDAHFLVLEGAIEIRKAAARQKAEPIYVEFLEAQRNYDEIANRRRSEALVVDWCRSLYSNYKQGK